MRKIIQELDTKPTYIFKDNNNYDILYFDIETTGFSPENTILYMIGAAFYSCGDKKYKSVQWFAMSTEEELEILVDFVNFTRNFKTLIHYNGLGFDIPYIIKKCDFYGITHAFDAINHIDLYKILHPYKKLLKLDNYKQKSVEKFLGINRDDIYNGGQLINVFYEYVKLHKLNLVKEIETLQEKELLNILFLHNFDDIKGLLAISKIINYSDLFVEDFILEHAEIVENNENNVLNLNLTTLCTIPKRIVASNDYFSLDIYKNKIIAKIKVIKEELKFFHADYKDYYYLPVEDCAIHKSLATFVDKNHREKAKASNCYTRKKGDFLYVYSAYVTPSFKRKYKDSITFIELTKDFIKDEEMLIKYVKHILIGYIKGL